MLMYNTRFSEQARILAIIVSPSLSIAVLLSCRLEQVATFPGAQQSPVLHPVSGLLARVNQVRGGNGPRCGWLYSPEEEGGAITGRCLSIHKTAQIIKPIV